METAKDCDTNRRNSKVLWLLCDQLQRLFQEPVGSFTDFFSRVSRNTILRVKVSPLFKTSDGKLFRPNT